MFQKIQFVTPDLDIFKITITAIIKRLLESAFSSRLIKYIGVGREGQAGEGGEEYLMEITSEKLENRNPFLCLFLCIL